MYSQSDFFGSEGKPSILKPVFFPAAGLIAGVVLITAVFPEAMADQFSRINNWISQTVGWFYAIGVTGFLIFTFVLAASRFGDIRLGPDHAKPDYSFASWFAMLFSAGMGIGLMFFAVAEPITHFTSPPAGAGGTAESARNAMSLTYFHWGLHAWAIYAVVGLVLAYFGFRHRLPLTIRSSLYPLIGERIYGPIGHLVDIFAVMGTLFGVATSLGFGVSQVNAGLSYLFDIPVSVGIQTLLIALITAAATISVVLGLDKGIKRLSEANLIMALVLLVFIIVLGPTLLILNSFVENLGNYAVTIFDRSLKLYAYDGDRKWLGDWTIFYWGWWISWSPFVGMFIARISRGRTIREFLLGVLFVPSILSFLWMTAFGNSALFFEMSGDGSVIAAAVQDNMPLALFKLFEQLPLVEITSVLAIVLVATFFVTSSDSGSLVIDIITAGGNTDTPVWQRIFWAVTEGVVAAVLMFAGGLAALQTAAITSALPFAIIIVLAIYGLVRGLNMEAVKVKGAAAATEFPYGGTQVSWRSRLNAILSHPSRRQVDQYIQNTVRPALIEVAREIEDHDGSARAILAEDKASLRVVHNGESDFVFAVEPRGYLKPAFAFPEFDPDDARRERFYRAEVHLLEGGQQYDIYGYTKDQIIHDVLNQYSKHMHFLDLARS